MTSACVMRLMTFVCFCVKKCALTVVMIQRGANAAAVSSRKTVADAAAVVVAGRIVAAALAEIQARLAHYLARRDELAETFLVSECVTRAQ